MSDEIGATCLRPNYRRARELKSEMDEIRLEIEAASEAGNFSQAQDLIACLQEMEQAYALTGVTSEYEL
ncbi:hypothetical protein [Phenylobacterium sp.]|uniref:hypothetical protein n=1 Tax=Phenylobacterium sp. TaxID=1871053 RepID=UPI00263A2C59|nr:hypothetical protein [Phenylobacterium sp.]